MILNLKTQKIFLVILCFLLSTSYALAQKTRCVSVILREPIFTGPVITDQEQEVMDKFGVSHQTAQGLCGTSGRPTMQNINNANKSNCNPNSITTHTEREVFRPQIRIKSPRGFKEWMNLDKYGGTSGGVVDFKLEEDCDNFRDNR